ncbi:primosomal protein N' [Streptomyces oceani]|uniref:Probable replication restart protein PriA n=1 Tax=Streptomyces oceani TaxID=1075402 RepID=A0A1E7JYB9_9ACTN|nr:primosomal protein N' [Streptomyces oceani]OEU96664.1 primosome assembly protein PriA [Streptomyces oceani]
MSSDNAQGDERSEHSGAQPPEQLALLRETVRRHQEPRARPRTWRGAAPAPELPVARVLVDKTPPHLDRYFDYAVPAAMHEDAQPGVRVRVRFGAGERDGRREGGGLRNGFIVERVARSDFPGTLAPLAQVLSTERVLTPELLRLCRAVADRYAGSLADVVQLAVPPRMARAERASRTEPAEPPRIPEPGGWTRYPHGSAFLHALADGDAPRAVWTALPGPGWPEELARALAATLAGGRGALAVLPDGRAAERVDAALTMLVGTGRHVLLTADAGRESRYRRWLAVSRGAVRGVVGTRAAMFAPVRDLGLAALWDDGDAAHSDEHAPRPHAREVLLLRAAHERAGLLLGAHARTVEAAQLVESGWARPLTATREMVRAAAPRVRTAEEADEARDPAARAARLPSVAWETVRAALEHGPVLVQVPRRGYVPRLACQRCRAPARCGHCHGPLEVVAADEPLRCGWCARTTTNWRCAECGGVGLRGQAFGTRRTAEELGRAFPSVPVRTSGRDRVLDAVPEGPALVVSTPGAEPPAPDPGYAAALLLDGWALLGRADLRADEEALRRWMGAAALVRGQRDGGTVVLMADPTLRPVQALVRWDPAGHAARELAERAELGFPPASRMAAVSGPVDSVAGFLREAELPADAETLGPVPLDPRARNSPWRGGRTSPSAQSGPDAQERGRPGVGEERALIRVPAGRGAALAAALKAAQARWLAGRAGAPVRLRVDPPDIG